MEKLTFTIKFIILLVAFPVIMFTELTRGEKGTTDQKQNTVEKISVEKSNIAIPNHTSVFTQTV